MSGRIGNTTGYRKIPVNQGLTRIYRGGELVGTVRRGLDGKWYPQLPPEGSEGAAIHRLTLAAEAVAEYSELFGASGG